MTRTHGRKKDGTPITDEMVESLADEAEAGYDVEEILSSPRRSADNGVLRSLGRVRAPGP